MALASDLGSEHLLAASAASARPTECQGVGAQRTPWFEPRAPALRRYCAALAAGYATLDTQPELALSRAEAALQSHAGGRGALVLRARALMRLQRFEDAAREFARTGAGRVTPGERLDRARTLAGLGRWKEARDAYQGLVSQRELLPGADVAILLETASVTLLAGGTDAPARGEAMLAPLLRRTTTVTGQGSVAALLGLLTALSGREEEARAWAASVDFAAGKMPGHVPSVVKEMLEAWRAERDTPAEARELWEDLSRRGASLSWGPWAERRRAALTDGLRH